MRLFYEIAKAIIAKHEKKNQKESQKREQDLSQIREAKKIHDNLIIGLKNRFLGELSDEFKKESSPKYSIGDIALTHWYGEGDRWDGSVQSLQSHTPFRGPLEVEITGVYLDTAQIADLIDNMNEKDRFVCIDTESEYPHFKTSVLETMEEKDLDFHWCYSIRVPKDENKYWSYTWRENKFLDPKSDEARWSKKAFKNEQEYKVLKEEGEALKEKIRKQVQRVTGIHVIVR